jgi:hypothetical protein
LSAFSSSSSLAAAFNTSAVPLMFVSLRERMAFLYSLLEHVSVPTWDIIWIVIPWQLQSGEYTWM